MVNLTITQTALKANLNFRFTLVGCAWRNSSAASSSSTSKPNDNNNNKSSQSLTIIPNVSKEIQEIRIDPDPNPKLSNPDPLRESEPLPRPQQLLLLQQEEENPVSGRNRIHIEIGKDHRISYPKRVTGSGHGNGETRYGEQAIIVASEVSHLGWGHWYTLRELEFPLMVLLTRM
ncbi:probable serine/threonine-protein kinase At1g01540 [Fagus crenata]